MGMVELVIGANYWTSLMIICNLPSPANRDHCCSWQILSLLRWGLSWSATCAY